MEVIIILLTISLGVAAGFLGGFLWSVRNGQYEDTCTPAYRVLFDEPPDSKNQEPNKLTTQT
ncbi:MAG: cbb3-type cytochrome oxidase assembly protein CcoS [Bacteroidia bacterium]|nr:cbb3-type cytochrome oxidase assembly protein CcoS [Bacteroidia bacterium]